MLLQALYEYSQSHGSVMPSGCKAQNTKAVVHLTPDGQLIGVVRRDKGAPSVICPSVGNKASSGDKWCDPYVANEAIILGLDDDGKNINKNRNKRKFFIKVLEETKDKNPDAAAVLRALTDETIFSQLSQELNVNKVKPSDKVSFAVDGRSVHDDPRTIAFWHEFWKVPDDDKPHGICMISGEDSPLATTLKKTTGLASVGGIPSGDVITSFDKASFRSYGLDKFQIAPMGQDAADAIVDSLNTLIAEAPQLAGTKFVHWYKRPVDKDEDIIGSALGIMLDDADDKSDDSAAEERTAMAQVNELFRRVSSGEDVALLKNQYHILILSAYSGRVVIRRYEEGTYDELVKSVHQWYEDTSVVPVSGSGIHKHYKMIAMLMGIVSNPNASDVFKQLRDEFASLLPSIMESVLHGISVPAVVAQKALYRIRSDLYRSKDSTEGDKDGSKSASLPALNARAMQWLKAYVVREERKNNKEVMTMPALNPNHPNVAYHCGRLLAMYGEIQKKAFADKPVGVTVVEKYYSAMSSTPSRVINNLEVKYTHHLGKIQNEGTKINLTNELNSIMESIGDNIPDTLSTKEKAYFALGYHHELADLNYRTKVALEAKNASNASKTQNEKSSEQ